ncbi:MAG: hypothetical protein LBG88_00765 [Christensenellaceae bacterium]|nr:hypothetical protein [Christensenellaceae bacterium]
MKYFKIEGEYARNDGVFYSGDEFTGFFELDEQVRKYDHPVYGEVGVQHFWGVQNERQDMAEELAIKDCKPLMLGFIQTHRVGQVLNFTEIPNHPFLHIEPATYTVESKGDGAFEGKCVIDPLAFQDDATMAELAQATGIMEPKKANVFTTELTNEEVKDNKIKEFLDEGYIQNVWLGFRPEMRAVIEEFEGSRNALIKLNQEQEDKSI